jgi:actinorhodin biosynthesis protein ActVIA
MTYARLMAMAPSLVLLATIAVSAQQSSARLTTQDYNDIQQLYARYNLAIDTGNGEAWAATFTPDGVFNNTNKGHDALVQFIKDWREKRDGANRRHLNSNMVLTPTADGANASIYLLLLNVGVRPATIATTGIYEDVLVRTPQGWRFKSRIVHADPGPRVEAK